VGCVARLYASLACKLRYMPIVQHGYWPHKAQIQQQSSYPQIHERLPTDQLLRQTSHRTTREAVLAPQLDRVHLRFVPMRRYHQWQPNLFSNIYSLEASTRAPQIVPCTSSRRSHSLLALLCTCFDRGLYIHFCTRNGHFASYKLKTCLAQASPWRQCFPASLYPGCMIDTCVCTVG